MKLFLQLIAFVSLLSIVSCGKKDTGSGAPPAGDPPVVNVSKSSIVADNFDETAITVKDKNGNDVTSQATVTVNGVPITNLRYTAETAGTVTVKATLAGVSSTGVSVNCTSPGTSRHSQKVIVEQYTGTWCGWCPRVTKAIKDAQAISTNVFGVAVHNGDAFTYSLENQMRAKWSITGFPSAVINRGNKWTDNNTTSFPVAEVTSQTMKWAPLGLAIESSVAGTTITGKVKTQFNVTTSYPMTIAIVLIENGKVASQRNFYSNNASFSTSPFYSQPDPITTYVHDNILRSASTGIFGDAIPSTATVRDNVYEKTFSFNATGYDLTKCEILAMVSYGDGLTGGRVGVLNAQKTLAGTNKNYD